MVLDEPTNHLDIQSRNVLIEALQSYDGTFIVVSHDRNFIDNISNKVWYIENAKVFEYPGNYSEFQYHLENKTKIIKSGDNQENTGVLKTTNNVIPDQKNRKRLDAEKRNKSFSELKEKGIKNFEDWNLLTKNQLNNIINKLEKDVEEKEYRRKELEKLLEKEETYKDIDYSNKLAKELSSLDSEIVILYKKWTEISKAAEIQ